jgi:hypothetical protein
LFSQFLSGINFGANPFGINQQQQQQHPAFAHQQATFFGQQVPSGVNFNTLLHTYF